MPRASLGALLILLIAACGADEAPPAQRVTDGDPQRGRAAMRQYGCAACHDIPGLPGANGVVGPPLHRFGARSYIAGTLPNRPETLVRWLIDPPSLRPETAMPDMHVTPADARHMAAYLYTLR